MSKHGSRFPSQPPGPGARRRSARGLRRYAVGTAVACGLLLVAPRSSLAADFMVQSSVVSQNYQIRDASDSALTFLRLDTYLRLFALDLLPKQKDRSKKKRYETQLHFMASMRLRADFAGFTSRWNDNVQVAKTEYGGETTFELLFAHLSVTDIGGVVDLRLGRQFYLGPMEFYGFDGLHARFKLPYHLAVELVGGLRNSGRYAIDAPIFLLDGTDLTDSKPGWLPMFSVAVETRDLSWLSVRLAYRATWHVLADEGSVLYPDQSTGEGTVPKTQMAEEKLSFYARTNFWKGKLQAFAGIRYNLLTDRLDEGQFGLASSFGKSSRIQAEYVMESPDFDGDSIFNIFNTQAYQEVRLWYEHRFTARWRAYARFTLRLFSGGASNAPEETEQALAEPDFGGGLGFAYVGRKATARADLYWQEGYGGRTLGVYGYYRHTLVPRWFAVEARALVAYWDDELSVTPEGVTAGLALGGRLKLWRRAAIHLLVEDNFGTYSKSDLRIYALLNVSWCTWGSCPAGEVVP
ncbi:MAG: hypothetical protein ABI333_01635 [bacterium]